LPFVSICSDIYLGEEAIGTVGREEKGGEYEDVFAKNTRFSITGRIFKIVQKYAGTSPPGLVNYIGQVENTLFFPGVNFSIRFSIQRAR